MSGIRGVYVAALTPRRQDSNEVDLGSALDLVDWLSQRRVDGIAMLGSTGEFLHFDLEDRLHLIQFAVKRSRVPVLANVSHSLLDGAITLARGAISAGAAALLLMPPYFFVYSQEEILEFYVRFAAAVGDAVPLFLYNIPAFTNEISLETASELLSSRLFAGIKDSSGNLEYFRGLQVPRERTPFTYLAGNDTVFTQERKQGADGVVSGVACALPELMVALDRAIAANDAALTDRLETRLREFLSRSDIFPTPVAVKEAALARGLRTGPHAVPPGKEAERKLAEFREWFRDWFPVVLKELPRA